MKADIEVALVSITQTFTILTGILALISLFLAFFLLLISMTQNINEAVWEYGVLRSMGVTKAQGLRVFLYEAYLVIVVASGLGLAVGFALAVIITYQFYSFIELPPIVEFPWILTVFMIGLALATTFVAVIIPVSGVNGTQIARVLKAGA